MNKTSLTVIIPCFNVSTTLESFFDKLNSRLVEAVDEFVLLDNASEDDTLQRMRSIRARLGSKVTIFANQKNYGYGGNIKIGFDYCLNRGYQYIAILHGDDQANSNTLVSQFLEIINTARPDLILATRFAKGSDLSGYDKYRIFGNVVFNCLTQIITGVRMSDAGAGIICVSSALLADTPYRSLTNGFQFHPQLNLLFYGREGIRIQEIPLVWSDSLAPSSIKLFRYAVTLLRHLVVYRYRSMLGFPPERYFFDSKTETDLQTRRID